MLGGSNARRTASLTRFEIATWLWLATTLAIVIYEYSTYATSVNSYLTYWNLFLQCAFCAFLLTILTKTPNVIQSRHFRASLGNKKTLGRDNKILDMCTYAIRILAIFIALSVIEIAAVFGTQKQYPGGITFQVVAWQILIHFAPAFAAIYATRYVKPTDPVASLAGGAILAVSVLALYAISASAFYSGAQNVYVESETTTNYRMDSQTVMMPLLFVASVFL